MKMWTVIESLNKYMNYVLPICNIMWLDASTLFVLNGILIEKGETLRSAEFSVQTFSVVLGFA